MMRAIGQPHIKIYRFIQAAGHAQRHRILTSEMAIANPHCHRGLAFQIELAQRHAHRRALTGFIL